jgi:hypothetical protein
MNIIQFLRDILPALTQLAALTSTTIDDTLCEFVRLAVTNEAVAKWLQSLISGGLSLHDLAGQATIEAPPEVHEALAGRKIDWQNLVTNILPKVLKIVALFG